MRRKRKSSTCFREFLKIKKNVYTLSSSVEIFIVAPSDKMGHTFFYFFITRVISGQGKIWRKKGVIH